ncbi:hypothetical protein LT493_42835 [Streptomyces tricolor]|nr:hypothetical protein [Streptomyces tricolor]
MTDMTNADVTVRPATPGDRPAVERLWLMFRHDLSGFRGCPARRRRLLPQ